MRTRRRPLRLVLPVTVAVAGALLAGCTVAPDAAPSSTVEERAPGVGESADVSTVDPGPQAGVTTGVGAWCALSPPELVAQVLTIEVQPPTATFTDDGEIRCSYRPVQAGGPSLQLRFRTDQDHDSFVAYQAELTTDRADPVADVPNLGDEAFVLTNEFEAITTQTLVARGGTIIVVIVAPATVEQVAALATQVFASLS